MSEQIRELSSADLRTECMKYQSSNENPYCLTDEGGQHQFLRDIPTDQLTKDQWTTALGSLIAHTTVPNNTEVPTTENVYGPDSVMGKMLAEMKSRMSQIASSAAALGAATKHTCVKSNPDVQGCVKNATHDYKKMYDLDSFAVKDIIAPYEKALEHLTIGTQVYTALNNLVTDLTNFSPHGDYLGIDHTGAQKSVYPSHLLNHQLGGESVKANQAARSSGQPYWHVHDSEGKLKGESHRCGGLVRTW